MRRAPIRVLLFAEEPGQASYLETILRMEAPGVFQACRWDRGAPGGAADLVLAVLDAPCGELDALLELADPVHTPTVIVSARPPGLPETLDLMRRGAEDVLGLLDLSPRRLVAALLKAVERKARAAPWTLQGGLLAPGGLLETAQSLPPELYIPQEA